MSRFMGLDSQQSCGYQTGSVCETAVLQLHEISRVYFAVSASYHTHRKIADGILLMGMFLQPLEH